MLKRGLAFILAWLATFLLASTAISHAVLSYLSSLGRDISAGEWLGAVLHDWLGHLPLLGTLTFVAMLIAFLVVAVIVRALPGMRTLGYIAGGFSGMLVLHLLLRVAIGWNPVWGVDGTFGLLLQAFAGAVGGYLYLRINPVAAGPA